MDTDLQDEFRAATIKKWLHMAWEIFCQCDLLATETAALMNQRNATMKVLESLEKDRMELVAKDDKSFEARSNIKSLASTIANVKAAVDSFDKKMASDSQKMLEKRTEAIRYVKVAKNAESYIYNAPPEASDAPPVEAISAEAAGQENGVPKIY
jgi:hypothetical protein